MVIAGTDKGKTGVVTAAFPDMNKVLVEGVNMKKKHQRPKRSNQKGQVVEKNFPIHVSNVMMVDPKTNTQTRIGVVRKEGKRSRITKKSQSELV